MSQEGFPHTRRAFYIPGRYINSNKDGTSEDSKIMAEQMYVEELKPLDPAFAKQKYPIVFWHGMCQTGMGWVTKPDGNPGWASYFLEQGHTVFIVDTPERGRSAHAPGSSSLVSINHDYVEKFWTATAENGGLWPQAHLHSQWPGRGKLGDPVFDQFMASQVQSRNDYLAVELLARDMGAKLFEKIGPAILCTHSQAGGHGWVIADAVPDLVKAVVALEPIGPPFINRVTSVVSRPDSSEIRRPFGITVSSITYDPAVNDPRELQRVTKNVEDSGLCDVILQAEPARKLANLSKVPVLIVTSESGYHARYDHATVAYMKQAGVDVTWMNLPEEGIKGNGHFMFLECNSRDIAERIDNWLTGLRGRQQPRP